MSGRLGYAQRVNLYLATRVVGFMQRIHNHPEEYRTHRIALVTDHLMGFTSGLSGGVYHFRDSAVQISHNFGGTADIKLLTPRGISKPVRRKQFLEAIQ